MLHGNKASKCWFLNKSLTFSYGVQSWINPSTTVTYVLLLSLMSRIERKYCLFSTSYLAGLFEIFILFHIWQKCLCFGDFYQCGKFLGRVVRKPVNVNPGLNANWGIIFSCLKMFFTSNARCSLTLLQLKTEGQTMLTDYLTKKLQNWDQNSR